MAKYIELIGVSGVGKTTTYTYLNSLLSKRSNWIPSEHLFTRKFKFKEALKILLRIGASRKNLDVPVQDWKLIEKFCLCNPELVDLYWSNFPLGREKDSKDFRYHSVGYILKIIEKLQQVFDSSSEKFVLVDEGLVHNLNYFTNSSTSPRYSEFVNSNIDLIRLPSALIYFDGDIKTVLERTSLREKINYRDNGLSIENLTDLRLASLREKEIQIKAVASKGIPVLKVGCKESVIQKSHKILDFINHL